MALIDDPVAMGFLLVSIAGACSPLGASIVFVIRSCKPALMCMTLGLAAGVMIFVALTEALGEAIHEFEAGGLAPPAAQAAAYGMFFVAFPMAVALDRVVGRCLDGGSGSSGAEDGAPEDDRPKPCSAPDEAAENGQAGAAPAPQPPPEARSAAAAPPTTPTRTTTTTATLPSCKSWRSASRRWRELLLPERPPCSPAFRCMSLSPPEDGDAAAKARALQGVAPDEFALVRRVNIMTLTALIVHNLPEGLATFAGYYASPRIGMAIAVAIAMHNIPEGIVLGVGVLAATGSRLRAVAWATIAGLAEPLGALIAWGVIAGGGAHPAVVAALLALAAGIMAFIALLELLPSALKFGSYTRTATSTFAGMALIALSLVLLTLWAPEAAPEEGVAQLG